MEITLYLFYFCKSQFYLYIKDFFQNEVDKFTLNEPVLRKPRCHRYCLLCLFPKALFEAISAPKCNREMHYSESRIEIANCNNVHSVFQKTRNGTKENRRDCRCRNKNACRCRLRDSLVEGRRGSHWLLDKRF